VTISKQRQFSTKCSSRVSRFRATEETGASHTRGGNVIEPVSDEIEIILQIEFLDYGTASEKSKKATLESHAITRRIYWHLACRLDVEAGTVGSGTLESRKYQVPTTKHDHKLTLNLAVLIHTTSSFPLDWIDYSKNEEVRKREGDGLASRVEWSLGDHPEKAEVGKNTLISNKRIAAMRVCFPMVTVTL